MRGPLFQAMVLDSLEKALPLGCRRGAEYSRMGCCKAVANPACLGIRAGASAPQSASPASGRVAVPCHLAA